MSNDLSPKSAGLRSIFFKNFTNTDGEIKNNKNAHEVKCLVIGISFI